MAINVDTSKPLSDEQIEDLRTKLPENMVQRYITLANEASNQSEAPKPGAKPTAAKGGKNDPDILT